jgi:hypothetical protein
MFKGTRSIGFVFVSLVLIAFGAIAVKAQEAGWQARVKSSPAPVYSEASNDASSWK